MVVFGCFIGFCDGILPKIGVFCALFWMLYNEKWRIPAGLWWFLCGFCPALVLNLCIKYKE